MLCAPIFLIAITGSALVYWRELDAALNPALYRASPGPDRGAALAMAAAATVSDDPVFLVRTPDPIWPVWVVSHAVETPDGPDTWTTHVDPATGAVLGRRDYGRSAMHTVLQLHYTLLLRPWWGMEFVGTLGLVLLASAVSGLWLWWPRGRRHAFRISPRPRGRLWLDLHRVPGALASVLLLVVAYSGVALIFPTVAVLPLTPVSAPTPLDAPKVPDRGTPYALDADAAIAAAEAALPGHRTWFFLPPEPPFHVWRVSLKAAGANPASAARNILWLDPWSHAVVAFRTQATMGAADRWITAQSSLHGGAYLGEGGRAAVFAAGLALAGLSVTGPVLYARRRRAAKRRDRGGSPPPSPAGPLPGRRATPPTGTASALSPHPSTAS